MTTGGAFFNGIFPADFSVIRGRGGVNSVREGG